MDIQVQLNSSLSKHESPPVYSATTFDIEVIAEPWYRVDQSDPDSNRYVWSYRITIINRSERTVQLNTRYWRIIDATGHVEEVRGPGVVGDQPILGPDDSYQYVSGCPLPTSSGTMVGHYDFVDENGEGLRVAIPAFSLDMPDQKRVLN